MYGFSIFIGGVTLGIKKDWSTEDWRRKLKQQAEDSKNYRQRLYEKVDLKNKKYILDVGCGTGAITMDIAASTKGEVVGIDIDEKKLEEAKPLLENVTNVSLKHGDVEKLPFADESFDLVVFNIVLIHIKNQQKAVDEMVRVTKKNGMVLATFEPDYECFINYPENAYNQLFKKSVKELGADMQTGRKLKTIFSKAGLRTEVGLDIHADFILINDDKKHLAKFLENFWFIEKIFKSNGLSEEQIEKFKKEQVDLIKKGQSFSMPTGFYAIGIKQ
jgi:ubiquinone/menaquinone biosynthesis C-methylase UbiE